MIVCAVLGAAGAVAPPPALAQQDGAGGAAQVPTERSLTRTDRLDGVEQTHARRQTVKDIGGIKEISSAQSWVRNATPTPQINFDVLGTPKRAGDINGDGTNDYVYTAPAARDEQTSALEDTTGKTAVFFGGTPGQTEDQLLYEELHPVGDLNGDGYSDAVRVDTTTVVIYEGSSSGYVETPTSFTTGGNQEVRGFTDLDGDGLTDALLGSSSSASYSIIYGNSTLSNATLQTYTTSTTSPSYFRYNTADLNNSGDGSIVRLEGVQSLGSDTIGVREIGVSGTRTVSTAQRFVAEELEESADVQQLSLVDIDANQTKEIVSTLGPGSPVYAFSMSAGDYSATPFNLGKDDAVPVGDLDGDGGQDFYTYDDATDTRYLSFGVADLGVGLSFDTPISYASSAFGSAEYRPNGGLGDVTGNGRADAVLGYTDAANNTVGRRFVSVDTDGVIFGPTDVTYARENFFDTINETNEIGDFNGDGTTDFAIVRNDLGIVEVFYGADPISSSPSLTITPPADSLKPTNVSSGDFNGDGASDLLVGLTPLNGFSGNSPVTKLYFGGSGADATADHTVLASDVGFPLGFPRAIGDVNDDGATDWMATDRGLDNNDVQEIGIFFGGSTLPTTADQTLEYPAGTYLGEVKAAVGDVNGDGIDDFAFNNTVDLQVDVYFGGSSPTFSRPADLTLPSPVSYIGIAGGDFNGDGTSDIATLPYNEGAIQIYHGGSTIDATVDQRLLIPAATGGGDTDGDGYADNSIGVLKSAGDVDGDGADELVHGSSFFGYGTNGLLFQPSATDEPIRVFRAPNQDAALGSQQFLYSAAIGDFTGNGNVDFIATQFNDNNDASFSSRVYRFPIGLTPPSASITPTSINTSVSFADSTTGSIQIDNTASGSDPADLRFDAYAVPPTSTTSKRAPTAQHTRRPAATWSEPRSTLNAKRIDGARTKAQPGGSIPPLLVDDPVVDDTATVNLDRFHAGVSNDQINVVLEHATDVDTTDYSFYLALDVDQDTSTGTVNSAANPQQSIGAEYEVFGFNLGDGTITLTGTGDNPTSIDIPVGVDTTAVHFAIPLSAINGSPPVNVIGIVATQDYVTDWFPNTGNVTVGTLRWLSLSKHTGAVAPGQTQSISLTLRGTATPPGTHNATVRITSTDPTRDTTNIPVSLDIDPPAISVNEPGSPPSLGSSIPLSIDVPATFTPTQGTLFFRPAGSPTFRDTTIDVSSLEAGAPGTVSTTIPGDAVTETGVSYYLALQGPFPDGTGTLQFNLPGSAPTNAAFIPTDLGSVTAGGPARASAYRMVSVPVDIGDRSPFDVLETQYGAYNPASWRLARWSPEDSSYAEGGAVDSLRRGKAAWLITAQGDSLEVSDATSADASGPTRIPLPPGWNQIGNPFPFPVAWADVDRPDAVRSPFAYDSTGYRSDVQILSPWRGVFVYNNADSTVTIRIPPIAAEGAKREASAGRSLAKRAASSDGYRLQARASVYRKGARLTDEATWLGFSEGADDGFGPKDRPKPPGIGPHVRLDVLSDNGPALSRSLKPYPSDGAAWDLRVGLHLDERLSEPKEVSIELAETGRRPEGFNRYVLDRDRGRRLPVTNGTVTVRLSNNDPTRRLRVVVGTEAFARRASEGAPLSIDQTKLRSNAPNPFRESTTIHYQLAEEQPVTITIFDVLGRRVRTLVDEPKRAGVHRIDWAPQTNGQALASGVYFCRMEAGSYTATRKLVLVR